MSLPPTKKLISNYAYCIKDKLGEGFSGEVFRGLDQRSGLPVAIKVVSKLGPNSSEKLELAETQIRVLDLLKGSCNILQLKQALQTKNSIYIISEYCSKGNLRALLNQRTYLSEVEAIKYILQVISGYQSIHQRGLLHRDIKPDNILITQQDQVRIGDFGFAISADKCYDVMPENIGTPLFMPYETLAHSQYSPKSDIWAIGITFLEMITGRPAWKANTQKKLITELENFDIQNIIPKGISEGSQRFLRKILQKDIDLRMSPEQLFSFSFDKIHDQNNLDKIKMALKKCTSLEVIYERQIIQGNPHKSPLQKLAKAKKGQQKSQKSTQEQSKTDFERISQIQSIQKLDSLKKIGSHKTINSLDQISTNNSSKIKDGLCRKFSEIKNQSLRHDESTECILNALGKGQTYEKKLTIKMQREALMEIQSQINYFRFIFKLFKKINDILKTNDLNIKKLKQNLLYFVHAKIDAIERLDGSSLSHQAKKGFKETPEFVKVLNLLAQYRVRYSKEKEKSCILTLCDEKCFASSLQKTIKILYQNIVSLQHNDEELFRKKNLVLILSDLVCLDRLHKLDLSHDWALFHSDSNITSALQRPVQSNLSFTRRLWSDLKQEINQKMCI